MADQKYNKIYKSSPSDHVGDEETGDTSDFFEIDHAKTATFKKGRHNVLIKFRGEEKVVPKFILNDLKTMRNLIGVKRQIPRQFGRTCILAYDSDGHPMITLGPHIALSICLIVTLISL